MRELYLLLVLLSTVCEAQQTVLNFHQLGLEDGLSQTTNEFLYTDSRGYTWIGSLDGVNLFDGKSVEVFKNDPKDPWSMKGVDIQSPFFEDQHGNIWFTTGEAINCYERVSGHFLHDFAPGRDSSNTGVHYAFFLENGRYLWTMYQNKVYRYDTEAMHLAKRQPIIENFVGPRTTVRTDEQGNVRQLYACFWNKGPGLEILSFNSKGKITDRTRWLTDAQPPFEQPIVVHQALPDTGGTWLATVRGLLFFNDEDPTTSQHIEMPRFQSGIKKIVPFSDRYCWLLTTSERILLLDRLQKKILDRDIQLYDLDEQEPIEKIDEILPVKDNIFWISTRGSGLYFAHINNNRFQPIFQRYGVEQDEIGTLFENQDGNVVAFSLRGNNCYHFDPVTNTVQSEKTFAFAKQIQGYDGTVWNISSRGLGKNLLNSPEFKIVHFSTMGLFFMDIVDYDQNYLILATNKGIAFFDKKDQRLIFSDYRAFTVRLYVDSMNRLWSGNASDELAIWQVNQRQGIVLKLIKNWPEIGLINHIVEDPFRQLIWTGTSKGLVKVTSRDLDKTLITEIDGLPNQYIYAIVIDQESNLWISTNKGIVRYLPEGESPAKFQHYTSRDGLTGDEFVAGAGLRTQSGFIWFGSTRGLDRFHPDSIQQISSQPKLGLNSLKIHGKEWVGDTAIADVKYIQLSHRENTLTFEIAALEYTDPRRNTFQAFLHSENGIDTIFLGTENRVNYASLDPGQYKFEFTACSAEGLCQPKSRAVRFFIRPPFYQTLWFRILAATFLLTLVSFASAFYYRYQLRVQELTMEKQQREAERRQLTLEKKLSLQTERNRIAREMHDELGGGLSTIYNASERTIRKENLDMVTPVLGRISAISKKLNENLRGIIWAMDPEFDTLPDFIAHIRSYSKQFLNDNELESTIHIPAEIPEVSLSSIYRHNLLLVIKEALHNVVKSAQAADVTLSFSFSEQLHISVEDDGVGFDPTTIKKSGFGLRNMTKRIKDINGQISWTQRPSGGTRVDIIVTMPK